MNFLNQVLNKLKMKLVLRKPEPECDCKNCAVAKIKILADGSHLVIMKCGKTEHIEK